MELDKIRAEYEEIMALIKDLEDILTNEPRRYQIIKDELLEVKEKYGDERRSEIDYSGGEMSIEDLIPDEKVVLTISRWLHQKNASISTKFKVEGGW